MDISVEERIWVRLWLAADEEDFEEKNFWMRRQFRSLLIQLT
jgi:hypothetical protein